MFSRHCLLLLRTRYDGVSCSVFNANASSAPISIISHTECNSPVIPVIIQLSQSSSRPRCPSSVAVLEHLRPGCHSPFYPLLTSQSGQASLSPVQAAMASRSQQCRTPVKADRRDHFATLHVKSPPQASPEGAPTTTARRFPVHPS